MYAYDKIYYENRKKNFFVSARRRIAIEKEIYAYEALTGAIRPLKDQPDIRLHNLQNKIDIELAETLKSLFYDHISIILLKDHIIKNLIACASKL